MTLVGKIFTVLIFIMSIVFMSFSVMVFATHRNWKELADNSDPAKLGFKQKLQQTQQLLETAKKDHERTKNSLAMEQASRRAALAALQTKLKLSEDQLVVLQGQYEKLLSDHKVVSEAAKTAQDRLTVLEAEVQGIRKEIQIAQLDRDTQFSKVVELTDRLNQDETQLILLRERNNQMVNQVASMKMVMDAHGLDVYTVVAKIPPKIDGIILEVSEKNLVEISLGKDDGLKEGHVMEVYRGNTYLGRIVIRKTAPDRAVGAIVPELKRGQIKKGDHVTTKLS